MKRSRITVLAVAFLVLASTWAIWSYASGGFVRVLFTSGGDTTQSLEALRGLLARWGRLAPLIYTLAVVIEVLIAPIPGTLLYAPAGALFGAFLGGTLSLAGNVIGAGIACVIGRALGERLAGRKFVGNDLGRYRELVEKRGIWVIFLLRVNPLTSSDVVSYAAGVVGVPVWQVVVGTLIGMTPLCYLQSYLAQQIFQVIPGAVYWLIGVSLIYVAALVIFLARRN
jgi:uncharacterized membrane protein YdjX (TVP38/TMEM64 family)